MKLYTSAQDFLATTPPSVAWILPGLIGGSGLTLLHAPPKTGKTTLAIQLAQALTTGEPFLRWQPERPWRVAYVQADAPDEGEWHTQLKTLAPDGTFALATEIQWGGIFREDANALHRWFREVGAEYVVWDSAYRLSPADVDLHHAAGVKRLMERLEAIWPGPGLLNHHSRKSSPGVPDSSIDSAAGHHTITAAVSAVWQIRAIGEPPHARYRFTYQPRLAKGGGFPLIRVGAEECAHWAEGREPRVESPLDAPL